jgi:hypothetical protein
MNHDLHELESSLAGLRPLRADQAMLDRLESAADGSLTELTVTELHFQSRLACQRPAALSAQFFATLEKVVVTTPFPVGEKIVMFTKGTVAAKPVRRFRPLLAAAAVALLGGATAVMMPLSGAAKKSSAGVVSAPIPSKHSSGFVPASYGNNVQTASDEGVIWKEGRPHRLVRLCYKEHGSFINAQGERIEAEIPRVEYILVPEKVD